MIQTLDKQKLVSRLKSCMVAVDTSDMNDQLYLYSIGYNAALTLLLIEIACDEFDA